MIKVKNENGEWVVAPNDFYKGDKGDETFVEVEYGVTTHDEILAIVDSGKIPYFINEASAGLKHVYYYSGELGTTNNLFFFRTRGNEIWQCSVSPDNTWSSPVGNAMQLNSGRQTALSSATLTSTTQYPSMKVMVDYVAKVLADKGL